jgi:2-dehydro-3-deoxygluconokinase
MDLNIRKSNWLNKSKIQNIIKKFTLVSNLIFLSEEDLNNINFKSIKKFCSTFCNNHSKVLFRKNNGLVYLYIKNNLKYKISLSMRKKVIDTTGCGDSFNASFIKDYLQDNSFFDTIKKAHKLASKVAMNRGAIIKKDS